MGVEQAEGELDHLVWAKSRETTELAFSFKENI